MFDMSLAKMAQEYVEKTPYIEKSLVEGMLNYSAVSRKIMKLNSIKDLKSKDALIIALRRLKAKKVKSGTIVETKSLPKFKEKQFENMSILVFDKTIPSSNLYDLEREFNDPKDPYYIMKGDIGTTVLCTEKFSGIVATAVEDAVIEHKTGYKVNIFEFSKGFENNLTISDAIESIPTVAGKKGNLFLFQNHAILISKN